MKKICPDGAFKDGPICNYEKITDTNIVCVFVRKKGTPISYASIFLAAVTLCTRMLSHTYWVRFFGFAGRKPL